MNLTRFYTQKTIENSHIRALRDLLMNTFNWGFSYSEYSLFYHDSVYSVSKIDNVDKLISEHGQPEHVRVAFSSKGGRIVNLETRVNNRISIDVDNKDEPPEKLLDVIESAIGIERLSDAGQLSKPTSTFIAHAFDTSGSNAANEVARFISLLGIRCSSGRAFSPTQVSQKVKDRLASHDLFIGIVTPHDDYTWITQEISTAAALKKPVFILKHKDVVLKTGILGDHEYIPFEEGAVSKTFIPILEGINEIAGRPTMLYPWQESEEL